MRTTIALAIAALVFTGGARAGDRPAAAVTGNARLDLFGPPASGPLAVDPSAPLLFQEQTADAAGEKSPWLAAALSLVVPGAGEVYAGSYIKGGAFFAAELAIWGVAYTYDKEGDEQTEAYKAYANEHWSATRYANWTIDNLHNLNDLSHMMSPDQYRDLIYPEEDPPCDPPFSCVDWKELNDMERDIANGVLNGYTHALPYYGEQQYYELIGKYEQFSRGWDDSPLTDPPGTVNPIRNTSERFREYSQMRARANDEYDVASTFVSLAVVNHVLSALDAYWSVTRFNKALHASVRVNLEASPYGRVPVTTASFRYDF